jgi:superfamily II DNA or RNA helicase
VTVPRDYQTEAVTELEDGPAKGYFRQVVEIPTGTGKGNILAVRMRRHYDNPGPRPRRVMCLVERDDLVGQTLEDLEEEFAGTGVTFGVIKATRNDVRADVVVGSIQTLARSNRSIQVAPDHFGLITVDEAHLQASQYVKVLEYFGCFGEPIPRCLAEGYTATFIPGKRVPIALSRIWQRIAFQRSVLWAIGAGWLVDPKGYAVELPGVDLESISRSGDDFDQGELGDALAHEVTAGAIVEEWLKKGYRPDGQLRRTVMYQPTRASAKILRDAVEDIANVPVAYVDGETPREERDRIYAEHRAGELPAIVNVGVLTTGWDSPETECAIIPPTRSKTKFKQCIGRILRTAPWSGKTDALALMTGYTPEMSLAGMGTLADSNLKVNDGESLKDAVERAANGSRNGKLILDELHLSEISLFGQAQVRWLRTTAGVRFVPLLEWIVFLWPEHRQWPPGSAANVFTGTYSVRVAWIGPGAARVSLLKYQGVSLEDAYRLGEQVALELEDKSVHRNGMSVASAGASWRRKIASDALRNHARQWGVMTASTRADGMPFRAGELSDRIATVKASKMLDRLLPQTNPHV